MRTRLHRSTRPGSPTGRHRRRGQASVEAIAVLAALAIAGGAVLAALSGGLRQSSARTAVVAAARPRAPVVGAPALVLAGPLVDLPVAGPVAGRAVAVARALLAGGVREEPPGSNAGPGVLVLSDGNAEPWCADFVSWVLRAAGAPFDGGLSGGWRIASASGVAAWFAARGRYVPRLAATPRPGDVVYFRHGRGHVGIVEAVAGETLTTIEGNAGDAVRRRVYAGWRTWWSIDGFGRPN